jgi:ribosome biogenesis protein ENP2
VLWLAREPRFEDFLWSLFGWPLVIFFSRSVLHYSFNTADGMNNAEGFKVSTLNGVKVYNLTAGKALPSFLSDRQKRNLNKRTEFQHRVQLIQDFEFPTASSSMKMSRNGEFLVAAGCYKPMIRIFELAEMGMKCERFVDSDIVKLDILSEDYSKLILLQSDRTLEIHAKYGRHFRTRIPKFGRDLLYQRHSCEVFVAASGSDVYRLNLELGQYLAPLQSTSSNSFNCMDQSPLLHLVGCGGDDGVVELYDTRVKKSVYHLKLSEENEVTALRFDVDGLTMTCGDEKGSVKMFDLRKREPLVTRQHPYEIPIKAVRYHHGKEGRKLITADAKTMRIWNVNDHLQSSSSHRNKHHGSDVSTTMFTTIEMPAALEDVCMCPRVKGERTNDSGLIMAAGEQSKIMTFYVPELGPAPKW